MLHFLFIAHHTQAVGTVSPQGSSAGCKKEKSTTVRENVLHCERKQQLLFVKKLGYFGIWKVTCQEPCIFIEASDKTYMSMYILHCFSIYGCLKDITFVEQIHATFSFDQLYANLSSFA